MLVDAESEVAIDEEPIPSFFFGHSLYQLVTLTLDDTDFHNLTISTTDETYFTESIRGECDSRSVSVSEHIWIYSNDNVTFYLQILSDKLTLCQFSVFPATLQLHSRRRSLFCQLSFNPVVIMGVEYNYQCSLNVPSDTYTLSLQIHGRWMLESIPVDIVTATPSEEGKIY